MQRLVGISLAILLAASVIPASFSSNSAYAVETIKTFDGNDYIDVPSSSSLQLAQFVTEVRFRISELPSERGYMISKGANGDSDNLDHNYAMYVTKLGKIGGGFKATDGTSYYIYSESPVTLSTWHVAKLIYDGFELKLKVDDKPVATLAVKKTADSSGTGPLRVGANANAEERFFSGDMDYVKVLDRSTFKKVYFNDFVGTAPDPDPVPDPDPTPVPDPDPTPVPDPDPTPTPDPTPDPSGSDCSDVPVKNFHGVVFVDGTLGKSEKEASGVVLTEYVTSSMKYIKANGFNAVRVPFYWEAYVNNPTVFMQELELVAKTAQQYDICVFFDNHHFYSSSYWNLQVEGKSDGRGFPSFVVKNFPARDNDYIKTAGPFWSAFLSNSISINGKSVWDVQADFFKLVIAKVDKYSSVAGYEILNEPHLFDSTQYEKLGNYNTYMAKQIRGVSDKKIFFDRETTRGFSREPSLEPKIFPKGVTGLVYAPHMYTIPYPGTQADKQIKNFKTWADAAGTEVLIGEMGAENSADAVQYLKVLKSYGFGWTAHSWKKSGSGGLGHSLYESETVPPTEALKIMAGALETVY